VFACETRVFLSHRKVSSHVFFETDPAFDRR